ncbi:MAG: hypothetical protein ACRELF_28775, partial [Gemmataceae bacterium]
MRLYNFVRAAGGEDQEAQHSGGGAGGARERCHEAGSLSIGQGGMMLDNPLRPFGKLLAQLLGELGGIAKVLVIDINILRDDGFD